MSKTDEVRRLLSSYYGTYHDDNTQATLHSDTGQSPTAVPAQPAYQPGLVLSAADSKLLSSVKAVGIDSSAFDADKYVGSMLSHQDYKGLLQKFVQVSTEVKTLDSDMQMLIYDNYNQFISALDVMKDIRGKTQSMEEGVAKLQHRIDSFAQGTGALTGKFRTRKQQMEELMSACRLAAALDAALQLPNTMQQAVERKDVGAAVQQYALLAPVLKRYSHKGAFRKAYSSVEQQRRALVSQLWPQLLPDGSQQQQPDQPHSVAEQCLCVQRLLTLGEDMANLFDELLASYSERMAELSSETRRMAQELQCIVQGGGSYEAAGLSTGFLRDAVLRVTTAFQHDTEDTVKLLGTAFGEPTDASERDGAARNATVRRAVKTALEEVHAVLHELCSAAALAFAVQARLMLKEHTQGHSCLVAGEVHSVINWGVHDVAEAVTLLAEQMKQIEADDVSLDLQQQTATLQHDVIRRHAQGCFQALGQLTLQVFTRAKQQMGSPKHSHDALETPLLQALTTMTRLVCGGLEAVLTSMTEYARHPQLVDGWQEEFCVAVQQDTAMLFGGLLGALRMYLQVPTLPHSSGDDRHAAEMSGKGEWIEALLRTVSPQLPETSDHGLMLLGSRLCATLSEVAVPEALEVLAMHFPGCVCGPKGSLPTGPPPFNATALARNLQQYAQAMLEAYVVHRGMHIAYAIKNSFPAILQPDIGEAATEALVLQLLHESEHEVVQLLDDGGRRPSGGARLAEAKLTGHREFGSSALERRVARLFHQHIRVFVSVQATQDGVLEGIAKVALKAVVEQLRRSTFTKQQAVRVEPHLRHILSAVYTVLQEIESQALQQLSEELLHALVERTWDAQHE